MADDISAQSPNDPSQRKKRLKRAKAALKKKIRTVDDEIRADLAKTRYARMQKQSKAMTQKTMLVIVGVALLTSLIVWIFSPRKGGTGYALCKTFVELRVEYPVELRYTYARSFSDKIRVWYVHHDSYGQKQIEKIDCFFDRTASGQIYMKKAEMNRGQIDVDDINAFNKSIPAILANPPDVTLPRGLPSDLKRYFKANE